MNQKEKIDNQFFAIDMRIIKKTQKVVNKDFQICNKKFKSSNKRKEVEKEKMLFDLQAKRRNNNLELVEEDNLENESDFTGSE
jgi:flagellar motor component MotA